MNPIILSLLLVVSVHDGDTVKLDDGRTIRLASIDAPEIAQPYGIQSRDKLRHLLRRHEVRVVETDRDRYGRTVANLYVKRRWINREMIRRGFAWHFRKYSNDENLSRLEQESRKHRRGLWKLPDAVAPWEWRKDHGQ